MTVKHFKVVVVILFVFFLSVMAVPSLFAQFRTIPVRGKVTMVDFGAKKCIPCKMMAPILERMEKRYSGRAAIIFIDVWQDQEDIERFGIRGIPTQIFFDKQGKEVYRHVGFMSEEAIVDQFKSMGIN